MSSLQVLGPHGMADILHNRGVRKCSYSEMKPTEFWLFANFEESYHLESELLALFILQWKTFLSLDQTQPFMFLPGEGENSVRTKISINFHEISQMQSSCQSPSSVCVRCTAGGNKTPNPNWCHALFISVMLLTWLIFSYCLALAYLLLPYSTINIAKTLHIEGLQGRSRPPCSHIAEGYC